MSQDNTVLLKNGKSVFNVNKHVLLCGTYLCPPDSPYYKQGHVRVTEKGSYLTWTKPFFSHADPRFSAWETSESACVNGCLSDSVCISTGSPQGCVLSSLLLIVYTNNCESDHENIFLITFSDDTAVVSLLFGDPNAHEPLVSDFVNWCDDSYIGLNVSNTKDLCIDFNMKITQTVIPVLFTAKLSNLLIIINTFQLQLI